MLFRSTTSTSGNLDNQTLSETDAALTTSGTVTVTDPDLPNNLSMTVVSVSASGTTNGLTSNNAQLLSMLSFSPASITSRTSNSSQVTWSFNSGAQAFNYLAKGEQLVLTYTIRVTDNNSAPTSDDHTVTVTINGSNDTPTASSSSGNVTEDVSLVADNPITPTVESDQYLTTSGSFTFDDVDLTDLSTVTVAYGSAVASSGATVSSALATALSNLTNAFRISGDGVGNNAHAGTVNWTFAIDNTLTQYLEIGRAHV